MEDPIKKLQGEVVTNDVPLPAPMPPTQPAPMPPAGFVSLPDPNEVPSFEAQKLQNPALTGNQQAIGIMGPGIQQEVAGMRFENRQRMDSSMSEEAGEAGNYTRTFEPPNLEESITRFGYNSGVLRESFRRQTEQRQNEDEKAWLKRNMDAIEAMSRPSTSATADSMGWVGQMLGMSEDGSRSYIGPAVFDKNTGEWRGSAVGGAIYGLGILQNSAIGAFLDITHTFQNLDKGMRQLYETFTPPWLRGNLEYALKAAEPFIQSNALHTLSTVSRNSKPTKYNDGKSNFVEALRGAQFSFSDKQSKSVIGLDTDQGFRLSLDPGDYTGRGGGKKRDTFSAGPAWLNSSKDKPGIDVNPGLLAGLALDVIVGGKIDKLAVGLTGRLLPKKAPTKALPPLPEITPRTPKVPVSRQLEIPFISGEVKSRTPKKVPLPENLKHYKVRPPHKFDPKKDIQQVLPIKEMMAEFAAEDKLLRPKAYAPGLRTGKDGQLSLRLDKIERVKPLPPPPTTPTKRTKAQYRQLKLNFDALPEAVPPKLEPPTNAQLSVIRTSEDVPFDSLPPVVQGQALNRATGMLEDRLQEIKAVMSQTPDIGRRFSEPVVRDLTAYVPQFGPERLSVGRSKDTLDVSLFHGTRVEDLKINAIDPSEGSALSEMGVGVYATPDMSIAELAARATPTAGMPSVPGRTFSNYAGDVHELRLKQDAFILDGSSKVPELAIIAKTVAEDFPALKGVKWEGKSLVQIIDTASFADNSVSQRLKFQQQLTKALRAEGVDGVRVRDNIAIYNTEKIDPIWKQSVSDDAIDPQEARYLLEDWGDGQVASAVSGANKLDSEAQAIAQRLHELETNKLQVINKVFTDIEYKGLMDHPSRVPSLEDYTTYSLDTLFRPAPAPSTNATLKARSRLDVELGDLFEKVKVIAEKRGVTVYPEVSLDRNVGGLYHYESPPRIDINTSLVDDPLQRLESLIHELSHHEIRHLVPYKGSGVTVNEATVEAVSRLTASVLLPEYAPLSHSGFQWFLSYLSSPSSSYVVKRGAKVVASDDILKSQGELIKQITIDLITDIKGGDFVPPSIKNLNLFGPSQYAAFVGSRTKSFKTLREMVDNHIFKISPDLPPKEQVRILATNPVTGALNTDVLADLSIRYADDLSSSSSTFNNKALLDWARDVASSNNPIYAKRTMLAKKMVDEMERGGTDYAHYFKQLSTMDPKTARKLKDTLGAQIDEHVRSLYC